MTALVEQTPAVWVLDWEVNPTTLELLGDARDAADRLNVAVGVLIVGDTCGDPNRLIHYGADHVRVVDTGPASGGRTRLREGLQLFRDQAPRLVFVPGTACGREWAELLAAARGWQLVSPALRVDCRPHGLEAVGLDSSGKLSRSYVATASETLVVTLRPGVGQPVAPQSDRNGEVELIKADAEIETVLREEWIAADPASMDIRDAPRLVAGGRGVGGREGFDLLRRFAQRLGAGVAASRMAVDLGWTERERQVGQTGKTVKPELYVACGISGASHHVEGMSEARHIVAINPDPHAAIFKIAHLGLAADFRATIEALESLLPRHEA